MHGAGTPRRQSIQCLVRQRCRCAAGWSESSATRWRAGCCLCSRPTPWPSLTSSTLARHRILSAPSCAHATPCQATAVKLPGWPHDVGSDETMSRGGRARYGRRAQKLRRRSCVLHVLHHFSPFLAASTVKLARRTTPLRSALLPYCLKAFSRRVSKHRRTMSTTGWKNSTLIDGIPPDEWMKPAVSEETPMTG
jgi:hypothetical protein